MKHVLFVTALFFISNVAFSQIIVKPVGCFAGTNGLNIDALQNSESRGVLISERWADIETSPGVFNFSNINSKIAFAVNANVKYSLAILGGAAGSPKWLMDSSKAQFFNTKFRGVDTKLPLWWDSVVQERLEILIVELGKQYSADTSLSHIYVTQMTLNGVEGHLNGVDMTSFAMNGYTDQKWISSAKRTTKLYAQAFPNVPIVFEVHEINHDTIVPATIINDLSIDLDLCERLGVGMWWISGKSSYQPNLVEFIRQYEGDKYAQIIGRSDQKERFQDSSYSTVFRQAKDLGMRYIEPWPYEFQFHTYDSLLKDFNEWADGTFSTADTCTRTNSILQKELPAKAISVYPNPSNGLFYIDIEEPYSSLSVSLVNYAGQYIDVSNELEIDISQVPAGIYLLKITIDGSITSKKVIKVE